MTNQEILTAVEEWVEQNEEYVVDSTDSIDDGFTMVEISSLITFIKKLLHE